MILSGISLAAVSSVLKYHEFYNPEWKMVGSLFFKSSNSKYALSLLTAYRWFSQRGRCFELIATWLIVELMLCFERKVRKSAAVNPLTTPARSP